MIQYTHIGVYALAIKDGGVLLIKKARGAYTGTWDLPGGSLEFGETPLEGLSRELLEETGLFAKEVNLLDFLSHTVKCKDEKNEDEELYHLGTIYNVVIDGSKGELKKDGDNEDSEGAKWINLSDIKKDTLSPFAFKVLQDLL